MQKLGIIALESARNAGEKIDEILSGWRHGEHFLIPSSCPRFGSGEALSRILFEPAIFIFLSMFVILPSLTKWTDI